MKYLLWALRIIVGALFIFSGLVKAIDPLGLSYKMDEFFEVWHMYWMMPYSLSLSVLMIAFEIIAGAALLFGYAYRLFSYLLLALIIFFTFLTSYVLFSGKIKECGCFGDCIPLTPIQTFTKDVILLVMGIVLVVYRNRIQPLFSAKGGNIAMGVVVVLSFGIQWYALKHLPIVDCLPYKEGVNIVEDRKMPPGATPDVYESVMIYEKDGVEKEFNMENYPWQDTTWHFVDRKDKLVKKGNAEPKIRDYVLTDYDGNEYTDQIIGAQGYTFLWYLRDTENAHDDNMDDLKALITASKNAGVPFYILCSDNKDKAFAFVDKHGLGGAELLVLDRTVSKTAMRSDPGLMLLKDGIITGKWSYADYPTPDVIK